MPVRQPCVVNPVFPEAQLVIENDEPAKIVGPGFVLRGDGTIQITAADDYSFPQRFIAGVPASAGTHDQPGPFDVSWRTPKTLTLESTKIDRATLELLIGNSSSFLKKETTMIDKKNFVTPPVKTAAGSLAHRHLGSLVTITLPSGAEITDILGALQVGNFTHGSTGGKVVVVLETVRPENNFGGGGYELDPKSIVLVRRPKVVKAKAAKR